MRDWLTWIGLCILIEAAVVSLATAKAVESSRFDGRSVGVAALICLGILLALTVVGCIIVILDEGEE